MNEHRVSAIGVDGARGGWVVVAARTTKTGRLRTAIRFSADFAALIAWRDAEHPGAPVGVDIPIGVRENGGFRRCDLEARALLGGRASTVFAPPGRYLLPVGGGGASFAA